MNMHASPEDTRHSVHSIVHRACRERSQLPPKIRYKHSTEIEQLRDITDNVGSWRFSSNMVSGLSFTFYTNLL